MSVERRRADRLRFLKRLHEITGGDKFVHCDYREIAANIGVPDSETEIIVDYLSDKHMVKWEDTSGGISITDYGVDVVEDALAHPQQPTADFPPMINILNIGTVTNSQIQQGTIGSSQTMTISGPERDAITRVLKEVRDIIATLPLSPEQHADVEGNAATVEAQLRTSKPSRGMIREALDSIRAVLSSSADAATVVDTLVKLAVALGAPGAS